MEGDEQTDESGVAFSDDDWPYDPSWIELAQPPLERLRQAAPWPPRRGAPRSPAAPTSRPSIVP